MKCFCWCLALLLLTAPVLKTQVPAPQSKPSQPQEPVYIYLYSRITDQVNLDITEARLRRILPMVERYRKDHPAAHVTATILFSGAASQALDESNAKTHIKDFVLGYKKRGIIEVGYDGTDEPTYSKRPLVNLDGTEGASQRWLARAKADEAFLTEARDPVTGDPLPGSVGGLMEMQKVFGEASCIAGATVGSVMKTATGQEPGAGPTRDVKPEIGDWELAAILRRYNTKAILIGMPESNPAHVPGFGGSTTGIGKLLSPTPDSSPDLFWADNVLRASESGNGARVIRGYEGPEALKSFADKLDRFRIRIVHMELGSDKDYLKPDFAKAALSPALSYAYAHPDSPKLPAEARLTDNEANAAFAKEEASLKWLVSDYFPANAGSRFVSSADLQRMAAPSMGYSIPVAALRKSVSDMLAAWGNDTYPPSYVLADGHYLSLAETFLVMADSLAEFDRTGKLPQSVKVTRIYGPITMMEGHGPNVGEVSIASIAKKCSEIESRLHDDTANPMPMNTVPSNVQVDGIYMNPAQFLRLMAEAIVNPSADAKLKVRMTYVFAGVAEIYPKTRSTEDVGATWTYKPAPLEASGPSQATR